MKTVLRIEARYEGSTLEQEFALYRALEIVEVRVTVDWRERRKLLKLRFPVNVEASTATFEIPYGTIERPASGDEEPAQAWVDVSGTGPGSGGRCGVSILNDGKYSFDMAGSDIGLTVLRSPIYAHHDPYAPEPGERVAYVDQGIQRFTYVIVPHAGDWREADVVRRAAELNQRPVGLFEGFHDGPLAQHGSYCSVEPSNVVVTVLKRAEEGDDLVLRCYETAKRTTEATVVLPAFERVIRAGLGPAEIKTFRIPRDPAATVRETDLIES